MCLLAICHFTLPASQSHRTIWQSILPYTGDAIKATGGIMLTATVLMQLSEDLPGVSLALSLHAPNQELRQSIVPSARAYKLDKLMAAVDKYEQSSRQKVPTFTTAIASQPIGIVAGILCDLRMHSVPSLVSRAR